ncbi:molecular chaperone DnaK [Sandaracinus amylolyticus]|uniref:molecular chaperone DnaK n=1 Tax=Sandaracinus amylolyticus TaxID=927083 RepID=UPI001F16A01D|nr:molecular chaperone DnaK [Sandaracinus amylolyticus]UJR83548.1 Hypothetical protein I5071_56160 [Sandaracinus amylolyticus]
MPRVVGIDLGTTNCCVAAVDGFRPRALQNRAGYKTTPSVIAVTEDGRRLVGQLAARQAVMNPEHTVHAAKRLIGRPYDSPQVRHAIDHSAFRIVEGPNGDARIELRGRSYSVPELSAMLLHEMRIVAEERLGDVVDRAVVTVPAYFNDTQRQAVRDAGRIAGLEVVRILNEPTAAAIAYGFEREERKTIVVYDMGGGTFDVSIVRVDPTVGFDVIATTGDSYLGGEDFDHRVLAWLLASIEKRHGIVLRDDPTALQRLREAAQKAKCELSETHEAEIQLPFLANGPEGAFHLDTRLARAQLERMTGDLVTRSLQICERALRLAEIRVNDVDEVILVGGMTRMPAIQRAVTEFFEREPCRGVHPDEVVALGAAITAFSIQGEAQSGVFPGGTMPLRDVTAHSLGIMVAGGRYDVLVPANTTVPTRTTSVFATSRDDQQVVKIVVLQGESEIARENDFLAQFALTGLRRAPAGEVEIEVEFEIDEDGIFRVAAMDVESGEAQAIEVVAQTGLDDAEIARMMHEAQSYMAERRRLEEHERARQGLEVALAEIDRVLPEAERRIARITIAPTAITKAREIAEHVRAVARDSDPRDLMRHARELEALASEIKLALG